MANSFIGSFYNKFDALKEIKEKLGKKTELIPKFTAKMEKLFQNLEQHG